MPTKKASILCANMQDGEREEKKEKKKSQLSALKRAMKK